MIGTGGRSPQGTMINPLRPRIDYKAAFIALQAWIATLYPPGKYKPKP